MPVLTHPETIHFPLQFFPQPEQDSDLLRYIGFIPGVKEIFITRQVHALEHATVQVLSKLQRTQHPLHTPSDCFNVSGLSNEYGFYIYGDVETVSLHQAVRVALRRLITGEWHLAIHPQCGTNNSVNWLMASSMALGAALGIDAWIPKEIVDSFVGSGSVNETLAQVSPNVGAIIQKYITTAIPFNLAIEDIQALSSDKTTTTQHFVKIRWIEP